ncbi:hypothetical protein N1F78_08420 [Seonamhaeicola sp. MEBiC1930]|uniref:hypothetical protein n=1 Tax=Seonamhaeicola sp. MEBiC01930 TaxID=2976768 RepID=UPI003255E2C3
MTNYLNDTEYATKTLFDALRSEFNRLENLKAELLAKKDRLKHLQFDFTTYDQMEDYNELQLQHKFITMAKFAQDANIPKLEKDIADTEQSIANKELSYQAIGMSILQIAKQGISKVHGSLAHCPNGRTLITQSLKNVIWQSRNQSIHHEDGNYHNNVKNCFIDLQNDFGNDFDLNANPTANLSTKVIDQILNWQSYEDYYNDMMLLK